MTRVLRGLAIEGIVVRGGRPVRADAGSASACPALAGALRVRGELYYRGAAGLLDAVRSGGTPFERVYGASFFDAPRRASGPRGRVRGVDGRALRAGGRGGRRRVRLRRLLVAWSTSAAGAGVLLAAILRAAPELDGVARRPPESAVEAARAFLGDARVVRGRRLLRGRAGGRRRLPALARAARLGRRGRAADPARLPRGDGSATRGCSSSTRSCPSAPSTSRSRSGWTCTCCCCWARASGPRRSSAALLAQAGFELRARRSRPARRPASA